MSLAPRSIPHGTKAHIRRQGREVRGQVSECLEAVVPGGWGGQMGVRDDIGGLRPAGRCLGESGLEATLPTIPGM